MARTSLEISPICGTYTVAVVALVSCSCSTSATHTKSQYEIDFNTVSEKVLLRTRDMAHRVSCRLSAKFRLLSSPVWLE